MMLCSSIKSNELQKYNNDNWYSEIKLDGTRAFLSITKHGNKLTNRKKINITERYPEIQNIKLPYDVLLDGELTLLKNGKSDFTSLMSREHLKDKFKIDLLSRQMPTTFYAFDIIFFIDEPTYKLPLVERKQSLEKLKQYENDNFKVLEFYEDLDVALEKAKDDEGIILKRKCSIYEFNTRSNNWLKNKKFTEKVIRFFSYETNRDDSVTLTDGFYRVKCNDKDLALDRLKQNGYVDCEVEGLEMTEKGHIRFPILRGII